jgi:branched-chain amino acid transport system ATP-binding protein
MSSLEVIDLAACHGQLTAVRGVGFTLAPGEVLALVGANGAGKTTLMRTLAGEHGRSGPWTLDTVLQALPALAPRIDARAEVLSGGQRQAVAIGRALMSNPDVLLLDEVSLGLSPAAIDGVYEHLWRLREARSTSLLLVEQDLTRALAFADRMVCLREGRIVLEGTCADLTREAVTAAYFGLETPGGSSGGTT